MYELAYSKAAVRALRKIPRNIANKIRQKLEELCVDPFTENNNVKALTGREGYRLRVGGWRVIYDVSMEKLQVIVIKVAPRGEVYK